MRYLAIAFFLFAANANAAIISKDIEYKSGDVTLRGTLVYDDTIKNPAPGIVLYPEWWGRNDYVKKRAAEMAALGYVALAADMYGDGKVTTDSKVATEWSAKLYKDRELMRSRARDAVETLKAQPNVDKTNIALTGFCFGGTNALELARAGDDIKAVAVFHAGLDFPDAVKKDTVKAHVLVMNGAADAMVKLDADQKFIEEMQEANADVELDLYGHAKHAFTNPEATEMAKKNGMDGIGYEPKAEARSMARIKTFLDEVFGK